MISGCVQRESGGGAFHVELEKYGELWTERRCFQHIICIAKWEEIMIRQVDCSYILEGFECPAEV